MREKIVDENSCALILSIIKGWEPEICLRKCGIEVHNVPGFKIKNDQIEAIKIYYHSFGMSLTDIGKLYDCSGNTIKSFLNRAGIPIKQKRRYAE